MASSASDASTAPCWRVSPDKITRALRSRASRSNSDICRPPICPASSTTTTAPSTSSRLSRKLVTVVGDGNSAVPLPRLAGVAARGRPRACPIAGLARPVRAGQNFCPCPRRHETAKPHWWNAAARPKPGVAPHPILDLPCTGMFHQWPAIARAVLDGLNNFHFPQQHFPQSHFSRTLRELRI
jgi:hypothetical protein